MDKVKMICPVCSTQGIGWLYDQARLPFFVSEEELEEGGGIVRCELCDNVCIRMEEKEGKNDN